MNYYLKSLTRHRRAMAKILSIMRLIVVIMTTFLLQVSAAGLAQNVTLKENNASLYSVIQKLRAQTGYDFLFDSKLVSNARKVSIDVRNIALDNALKILLKDQELTYSIKDKFVVLEYKQPSLLDRLSEVLLSKDIDVRGIVLDEKGEALAGAVVTVKGTGKKVSTTSRGEFYLQNVEEGAVLVISYLGYERKEIKAVKEVGRVQLMMADSKLEEVEVMVNTGYQILPKERATGSFVQITNKELNLMVGANIMDRLEAIGNGIVVDRSKGGVPNLMVRGLSTIQGPREVLVIVDNFPYEGDINNINPNDVESVTILKDAAAASIWGARAGNGVIVITTKRGTFNQSPTTFVNSNISVGVKPDLYKLPQVSSSSFVDYEKFLYEKGYYSGHLNNQPSWQIISPVVELLVRRDRATGDEKAAIDAEIESYKNLDVRDDMMKYLYRNRIDQQYSVSLMGGSDKFAWTTSTGLDKSLTELDAKSSRVNVRFQSTYKPIDKLELTTGIYYTQNTNTTGSIGYNNGDFYPYTRFADDKGNPVGIAKQYRSNWTDTVLAGKLLDWKYYPLTDFKHSYTSGKVQDVILNGGLHYKLFPSLNVDLKYQYEKQIGETNTLASVKSFEMRSIINMYTHLNPNGIVEYGFPLGGKLTFSDLELESHQFRSQINFNKKWNDHEIVAIGGNEIKSLIRKGGGGGQYGYDDELLIFTPLESKYLTRITNLLGGTGTPVTDLTKPNTFARTNFLSFMGNAAYTYQSKYTVSLSFRTDASNLFGLKINDQWNPFFSTGLSWNISNESFYKSEFLPYLKMRATYGLSGNIDQSMVAVTTIRYSTLDSYNKQKRAYFDKYYNPELKWETSKQLNIGADFASKDNFIKGSLELFHKRGINLFGKGLLDPTGGVGTSITKNVSSMWGKGMDLDLSVNLMDRVFKWNSKLNFSIYKDELVDYYIAPEDQGGRWFVGTFRDQGKVSIIGLPVNAVLSFRSAGLDPQTGDPLFYLHGAVSKDYRAIMTQTKVGDLRFHGSAIPTHYGSFINSFAYKNLELYVGLSFKLNYNFRRETINYADLARISVGHSDFDKRWQKPGDEQITNIPSLAYPFDTYRSSLIDYADTWVERGDHVRLQILQLNYRLDKSQYRWLPFRDARIYMNANNLGIIWRANKHGIDPDYMRTSGVSLPPVTTYSLGINVNINN